MAPSRRQRNSAAESGGGMKTPEEINAANAEFWKAENERFRDRVKKYPHDLTKAAELATKLVKKGMGNDADLLAETSLHTAMHEAERLRQQDQSMRSKGKPKKRKTPTAKSVCIAAMRKARKEGQSLAEFLASAGAGSVEGLEITPANLRGVVRFQIEAEELKEGKTVADSTLEEWFTEAGKQTTPD
jgi:hypothetical protein